jgi:hypothetical protein
MSPGMFSTVTDRIRADFVEMPYLELTVSQAVRLWNLGFDDCRYVLDTLVDAGFLAWTPKRTVVRAGRQARTWQSAEESYVSVRTVSQIHNFA